MKDENKDEMKNHMGLPSNFTNISLSPNLYINESEYEKLRHKVSIQNKILNEYQLWANTLVEILSDQEMTDDHLDLGTPIQEKLNDIENLIKENIEIKRKILEQREINEILEEKIKIKKNNLNNCKEEFYSNEDNYMEQNKIILKKNLEQMANELEVLMENKIEMDRLGEVTKEEEILHRRNFSESHFSPNKRINSNASRFFIKKEEIDEIKKIKDLYYQRKELINENIKLQKIVELFLPNSIKNKTKIVSKLCGV